MRRSSRLAVPLRAPEDVIPHLGEAFHWKQGYSAKSLADRWFGADDVPEPIRALLDQASALRGAELLDGWLERETDLLDGERGASQTDLLALLGLRDGIAVLGIEAKVKETFGPTVRTRLAGGSAAVRNRYAMLCDLLGIPVDEASTLRYQLFHRTAAVLREARRFRARQAVLVVQSFCPDLSGLDDARAFFAVMGMPGLQPGVLLGPVTRDGTALWVGWATDTVLTAETA